VGRHTVRLKEASHNLLPGSPVMNNCINCGIPTRKGGPFCDVCVTMLEAVERPFFIKAQEEFREENLRRIRTKERLLHDSEEPELR
jgi:hypothetical protein